MASTTATSNVEATKHLYNDDNDNSNNKVVDEEDNDGYDYYCCDLANKKRKRNYRHDSSRLLSQEGEVEDDDEAGVDVDVTQPHEDGQFRNMTFRDGNNAYDVDLEQQPQQHQKQEVHNNDKTDPSQYGYPQLSKESSSTPITTTRAQRFQTR